MTNIDSEKLLADFNAASRDVGRALITTKGGTQAEQRYALTYRLLMQAGLAPHLKRKYRGR